MNLKIKFLKDRTVKDAEGKTFKQGQIIDLPYASAQHWLTRNVAVLVVEDEAPKKVEQDTKPEDSDGVPKRGRGRPPKEA